MQENETIYLTPTAWHMTVLKLRAKITHYKSLTEAAADIGITTATLRKVLKEETVSQFCTIKIEEWLKK